MQIVASESKWLRGVLVAALYVSLYGCATPPATTSATTAPAPVVSAPTPVVPVPPVATTSAVTEAAVVVAPAVDALPVEAAEHHIALILPLKSATFGKAAEAVQQGFMAAAALQPEGLPVRVYPCNDAKSEVIALYQQAIRAGAVAVAGPITRNGVAALATLQNVNVPTLALNVADDVARADQLYFFGLPAEQESKQISQLATKVGLLSATIVRTDTALSKRLAQSFSDNWQRSGGIVLSEIIYTGDPAPLRLIPTDPGNMVFLAAEVDKARLLRPYISNMLPVYATSQVFSGNANNLVNYDLAEVRFIDMPWVLQADHPAVMVYPRAEMPLSQDLERLYALGIDGYRLLQILYQHDTINSLPLDGVTGKVSLNGHWFEREAMPAVLRQGLGIPHDGRPPVIPPVVIEAAPKK